MNDTGPQRRFELHLTLGADDWRTLTSELENLAYELECRAPGAADITMGGVSAGRHVAIIEHPEQTPERYQQQLAAYIAQTRAARHT